MKNIYIVIILLVFFICMFKNKNNKETFSNKGISYDNYGRLRELQDVSKDTKFNSGADTLPELDNVNTANTDFEVLNRSNSSNINFYNLHHIASYTNRDNIYISIFKQKHGYLNDENLYIQYLKIEPESKDYENGHYHVKSKNGDTIVASIIDSHEKNIGIIPDEIKISPLSSIKGQNMHVSTKYKYIGVTVAEEGYDVVLYGLNGAFCNNNRILNVSDGPWYLGFKKVRCIDDDGSLLGINNEGNIELLNENCHSSCKSCGYGSGKNTMNDCLSCNKVDGKIQLVDAKFDDLTGACLNKVHLYFNGLSEEIVKDEWDKLPKKKYELKPTTEIPKSDGTDKVDAKQITLPKPTKDSKKKVHIYCNDSDNNGVSCSDATYARCESDDNTHIKCHLDIDSPSAPYEYICYDNNDDVEQCISSADFSKLVHDNPKEIY